jgi:hypothetical protein
MSELEQEPVLEFRGSVGTRSAGIVCLDDVGVDPCCSAGLD